MSEMPPPPTVPPSSPPPPGGGSYVPPPPPPPIGGAPAGSDRTLMLVLSYVWLLALIPLLTKKDDREVQWHAKNGLALAIAITVIQIAFSIFSYFFPTLGCLVGFVPCLIGVGYLVVCIVGIMKAINGQRFRIPMISDFADKA